MSHPLPIEDQVNHGSPAAPAGIIEHDFVHEEHRLRLYEEEDVVHLVPGGEGGVGAARLRAGRSGVLPPLVQRPAREVRRGRRDIAAIGQLTGEEADGLRAEYRAWRAEGAPAV